MTSAVTALLFLELIFTTDILRWPLGEIVAFFSKNSVKYPGLANAAYKILEKSFNETCIYQGFLAVFF